MFKPSTGVRDPLRAQALVLQAGDGAPLVLLTLDAIGVEYEILRDVAAAARRLGVPLAAERLVMLASHTHSGAGAVSQYLLWQLAASDRLHRGTRRALVRALARSIRDAWSARRPARLGSRVAPVRGVTKNRRADRSDRVSAGDIDPSLRVLRVDDAQTGRPLAALVAYAIHGTCLGASNLELSADVPGAIRSEARRRLGYPVLFANGCEGDVAPSGEMSAIGARLGQAVAELAPKVRTRTVGVDVVHAWHRFEGGVRLHPKLGADLDDPRADVLRRILGPLRRAPLRIREPFAPTRFRFTAARLGELVLVCVPGEPIVEVGQRLVAAAHAEGIEQAWVLGLANGHMGYVTTPAEYRQGGYEAWATLYGEDTGEVVERVLRLLLRRLAPL